MLGGIASHSPALCSIDILNHLLTDATKHEFVMEVTDKTRADAKVIYRWLKKGPRVDTEVCRVAH